MAGERYADPEARRIGEAVERVVRPHLPGWVAELRFAADTDWAGDPALRVWVLVRDEAADGLGWAEVGPVDKRLFDAGREVAPDRWPYIRFRTVAEQAELDAEPAGAW